MAYYLSKANKAIVDMLAEKLKTYEKDWAISTSNPSRLESALRAAYSHKILTEYRWIKDKWIIQVREGQVNFKLKQLHLEELEEPAYIVDDPTEFFDVLNVLVLQKKAKINFTHCVLTPDEIENLTNWGNNNGYELEYKDSILNVKKIVKIENIGKENDPI